MYFESEFVNVKLKGAVLVQDKYANVVHSCDHFFIFLYVKNEHLFEVRLLENCFLVGEWLIRLIKLDWVD